MKTLLFTFENSNTRDQFLKSIKNISLGLIPTDIDKKILGVSVKNVKYDKPMKTDGERLCGIWVSGRKLMEGPYADMDKKFSEECSAHSAAVVLRELRDGEWSDIRSRRIQ